MAYRIYNQGGYTGRAHYKNLSQIHSTTNPYLQDSDDKFVHTEGTQFVWVRGKI